MNTRQYLLIKLAAGTPMNMGTDTPQITKYFDDGRETDMDYITLKNGIRQYRTGTGFDPRTNRTIYSDEMAKLYPNSYFRPQPQQQAPQQQPQQPQPATVVVPGVNGALPTLAPAQPQQQQAQQQQPQKQQTPWDSTKAYMSNMWNSCKNTLKQCFY